MATTSSNTFQLAASADTLASSRIYFNSSFKALLQNFASANAIPVSTNIGYEDGLRAAPYGMLWYNESTGGIYVNTDKFGTGPYGNFRTIGTRSYVSIGAAMSKSYELDIGELIVIVRDSAGSAANNRVYLVTDENKTLFDVGTPYARSVDNTKLVLKTITGAEIANNTITADHIADGTVIEADFADESVTDPKLDSALVLLGLVI
jgi:hypothetical protein